MKTNRNSPIFLLGLWLGLALTFPHYLAAQTTSPAPQGFGTLSGKVTDSTTGSVLQGASVRVQGTSYETYTNERGEFRLPRVPSGSYRLAVSYLGYSAVSVDVLIPAGGSVERSVALDSDVIQMEEYQVSSILEGQARAINRQRAADTITTIVASDEAGNLPDLSIEDVLSRLAGISISGGGGVTIRGAAPDLNSVMLDGERMSYAAEGTSDQTRAVSVDNVDADLIASIEIIRALPASLDADGIGGSVNLVTRSALDLGRRIVRGRVDYTDNHIGGPDYTAAFTYGDVLSDRWGYILNLSYGQSKGGSERGEIHYNFAQFDFPVISTMDMRQNTMDRKRYGLNTTIDHKLGDRTSLYMKGFYNHEKADTGQYRLISASMTAWNPATATPDFAEGSAALQRHVTVNSRKRDYYRVSLGGRTEHPRFRLDYEGNFDHSGAHNDWLQVRGRIANVHPNYPGRDDRVTFTYDRTDRLWPVLTLHNKNFPGVDPLDIYDAQIVDRIHLRVTPPKTNYDQGYNARMDFRMPTEWGNFPVNLQTGLRYRGKNKRSAPWNSRIDYQVAARFRPVLTLEDFLEGGFTPTGVAHGRYPTLGAFPNPYTIRNTYLGIMATQTPEESIFPTGTGQVRRRLEAADRDMMRRTFKANEDIFATYAMGTIDIEKLRLIGGVRVEHTRNSYEGRRFNQSLTKVEPVSAKKDYTNYFPSLIGTYRLTDNHVLRGAVTSTIARPNYTHLIPFEILPDEEGEEDAEIEVGNPDLKSQKSRNYDLSYEWYFQPVGLLTIAGFEKNIDSFIYESFRFEMATVNLADEGETPDLIEVQRRVRTRRNGADARLRGVELSWQQQLTFLPSPLDGLGFNANYTYIKGRSRVPDDMTGGLITYDFLFRQAKDVYNAQLFYEKHRFNARVAVRYNGGWNQSVSDTGNVVINPTTYWDSSIQYNLTNNFTLFLEGKNMTKEYLSWWFMTPDTPTEWQIPNYGYRGGIKFRF